jgi:tRNA-dihydrouridine synthase B
MKELKIAGLSISNRYVQAPLAGYTTFAMRQMARKYGCGLTYTEMTSCSAISYANQKTFKMLPMVKEEGPLALQIFGGNEETIYQAVRYVNDHGIFDFLDFNLGCPAKKVLKQKAGSYWLSKPEELYQMMRKVVSLSSHPVIVKIRLGYKEINGGLIASLLEQAGVKAIAVHGRTMKEGFVGPVHYDLIGQIKKNAKIPIIANGNISLDNIAEVESITSADGFMFGRGALGNPKIFEDLINREEGKAIRESSLEEQAKDIIQHLTLFIAEKGEERACIDMRSIASFYLKGMENAKNLKVQLVRASTFEEYKNILSAYLD